MLLLKTYYDEMALDFPPVNEWDTMTWILSTCAQGGSAVVTHKGRIVGSVGCSPREFSHNRAGKYILNEWFTVHPKYRHLGIANMLADHCKLLSDKKSELSGVKIPFMFGIISGKDKRLDKFLEMNGFTYAGGTFMYNMNLPVSDVSGDEENG